MSLGVAGGAIVSGSFQGFDQSYLHDLAGWHAELYIEALMAGTDLPSTRARRPFMDADIDLVAAAVGDEHLDAVLWGNAAKFYRIAEQPRAAAG